MRLVFATNNRHKLEEVSAMLGNEFQLVTPHELGVTEDIPETSDTLEGNALQKAQYLCQHPIIANFGVAQATVGVPIFADDTGLEVEALGGAPGVYSARYAGEKCSFDDNCRLLLKNLEGKKNRKARFRTVIALIINGEEHLFDGVVNGTIIEEYRGEGGFGYDPIFVPEGFTKTFAEMDAKQKNSISHRARAIEKLTIFFKTI